MSISGAQRLAAGAAEASVLMNSVLRRLVTEASDLEHISQADVSSVEATPPASVAEKLISHPDVTQLHSEEVGFTHIMLLSSIPAWSERQGCCR